jgi:hypothetical protein
MMLDALRHIEKIPDCTFSKEILLQAIRLELINLEFFKLKIELLAWAVILKRAIRVAYLVRGRDNLVF